MVVRDLPRGSPLGAAPRLRTLPSRSGQALPEWHARLERVGRALLAQCGGPPRGVPRGVGVIRGVGVVLGAVGRGRTVGIGVVATVRNTIGASVGIGRGVRRIPGVVAVPGVGRTSSRCSSAAIVGFGDGAGRVAIGVAATG